MCKAAEAERGFSLIELMVVVLIIGILAAIAYSSYRAQVMKSNRTDAVTAITNLSQTLERCYSQNFSYAGCTGVTDGMVRTSGNGFYQIAISVPAANQYTLTATPVSGIQLQDTTCAQIKLTQTGARTATDSSSSDTSATCWRTS